MSEVYAELFAVSRLWIFKLHHYQDFRPLDKAMDFDVIDARVPVRHS
jgi:hypothetical protein